ncbi:PP2C family protein-serine/threonine phosphatase [Kitasatospora sp. NPDC048365]|uniref:PP2C family protein-serine/threonine phosphatase n=1 Tax=Kitasatospora sp. NPDC048365 TaxID=3364050 RepID=UPI003717B8EA
MLSSRRLTGSGVLLVVVVAVAALLAAGVAVVGLVLHDHHEEAARRLETRWQPAAAELAAERVAVGDLRAACLAGTGAGAGAGGGGSAGGGADAEVLRQDASGRLAEHLAALDRLTAGTTARLDSALAGLRTSTDRWTADSAPGRAPEVVRVCALPGPTAGGPAAAGTYADVDARTGEVAVALEEVRRREVEGTAWHMTAVLLYILGLSAALLVTAIGAAWLLQRRYLAPAAALAEDLRRTAVGDPAVPARSRTAGGWIGRLRREAEGVSERLALSQRQARRDQEALVQVGPAVQGLREILTGRSDPGPDLVVDADVRAAEGLIAGDYLGVLPLPDGATAVFLGDVSGHGVDAGLLAVRLKTVVTVGLRLGRDLDTTLRAVWQALAAEDERFTTLAVAVVDPGRSTLSWVNAGHEEPFLRRADGRVERLEATGPIVHPFLEPAPGTWQVRTTGFLPGDLLLLSTDGLTEGRGADGEEFGDRRVTEVLAAADAPTPQAAVRALYEASERFGLDWSRDDVSLLAAAHRPGPRLPVA